MNWMSSFVLFGRKQAKQAILISESTISDYIDLALAAMTNKKGLG